MCALALVLTLGLARAKRLAPVHARACAFTMPVRSLLLLVLHSLSRQEVAPDANFLPPSQL